LSLPGNFYLNQLLPSPDEICHFAGDGFCLFETKVDRSSQLDASIQVIEKNIFTSFLRNRILILTGLQRLCENSSHSHPVSHGDTRAFDFGTVSTVSDWT
jgi:hypothetical protein